MKLLSAQLNRHKPRRNAFRYALLVTGVYAVVGVLWIFYSDLAAHALSKTPEDFLRIQNIKGWLFILVSSVLILSLSLVLGRRKEEAFEQFQAVVRSLQQVLNNSPVDIMLIQRDGKILDEITTSRLSELILNGNQNISSSLTTEEYATIRQALDEVRNSGKSAQVRFVIENPQTADDYIFEGRVAPYWQDMNERDVFILAVTDTTQLVRAKTELSKMGDELKREEQYARRLQKELETFDYSVSNSLKVPLRHIAGFFELLQEDETGQPEQKEKLVEKIYSSLSSANKLVNDLYMLSRINLKELEYTGFNVSLHADTTLNALASRDSERDVAVAVQPGIEVRASSYHAGIALKAILENAWKFTQREEKPAIQVYATHEPEEGHVEVTVEDNGIGLEPDEISLMLEPYSLTSAPKDLAGHGLGLTLAHRVMKLHGGYLRLEGTPGHGAKVTLGFPEKR
jgi:hypothetical protein